MAREQVYNFGASGRDAIPSQPVVDGVQVAERVSGYGDQYVQQTLPGLHALALEGTLFEFHNPVLESGTSIAGHPAPVLADIDATFVKPLFYCGNILSSSDRRRLHLLALEIEVDTAGATGSDSWWADEIDDTGRFTTAGTPLTVVNPNAASSNTLGADSVKIQAGPIVVPVETSACRKLGFRRYRQAIEVAADRKVFLFGDMTAGVQHAAAPTGRTDVFRRPPVILPPGRAYMLGLAAASQNAAGIYKVSGLFCLR
jgi:hypothetical protein